MKRRHFLVAAGVVGSASYAYQRGLRYPRLGFEHRPLEPEHALASAKLRSNDCIVIGATDTEISLRAYSPEPVISITPLQRSVRLKINNIALSAALEVDGPASLEISESIDGINRTLELKSRVDADPQSIKLNWYLPDQEIDFAVIGDTGGNIELDWCIRRANSLGAKFLLHLGDFNYTEGEYQRAIAQFKTSPIPVYVSIGNHDYNQSGLVYPRFLAELGPLNHAFSIAGTRFVNLDTGADFFPAHAGNRGQLVRQTIEDKTAYADTVVFTHRVVKDPRPGQDHVIGGVGEIDWLCKSVERMGGNTLLTGHVHRSADLEHLGVRQITAGEGLGFENVRHQKEVAQILMAKAKPGEKVSYQWQPLNMPWTSLQSPTHLIKMRRDGFLPEHINWFERIRTEQDAAHRQTTSS